MDNDSPSGQAEVSMGKSNGTPEDDARVSVGRVFELNIRAGLTEDTHI